MTRKAGTISRYHPKNASRAGSLSLAALLLLTACGERPVVDTPQASDDDLLKASDVIVAAQCEINRASARADKRVPLETVVLTMSMTVIVSEATGGAFTLAIPVAGSRISLDRARRPIGSAVRRMDVQIVHDVGAPLDCPTAEAPVTADGVRFIEGGLGLGQWISETDKIASRTGTQPTEVNYSLGFDIALSDSFNPVFSRSNDDGISPDVSPEASDSRRVAHRLALTAIPSQPGRATPRDEILDAAQRFLQRIPTN